MGKKEILDEKQEGNSEGTETVEIDEKDQQILELQEKITILTTEIETLKKAAADVINRNRQIESDRKYASSDLIKRLLIPMSYFEGALKLQSDDETFNNFLKGFDMIYNLIFDTLKSDGLKEVEAKVNNKFDPRLHEVAELVEVDEGEKDIILEVIQSGYLYKDRVIKPAQVKVSTLKKLEEEDSENIDKNEDNVN